MFDLRDLQQYGKKTVVVVMATDGACKMTLQGTPPEYTQEALVVLANDRAAQGNEVKLTAKRDCGTGHYTLPCSTAAALVGGTALPHQKAQNTKAERKAVAASANGS